MKKFTLLSLLVILSFVLFAQSRDNYPRKERKVIKEEISVSVTQFSKVEDFNYALRAFGDVIYEDDFSSGGPGAGDLPTGWSSVDTNVEGNNYIWQWTDVGAIGPYSQNYTHVLNSPSAANGWLILDSDNYMTGHYDTYLYSPSYDLTGYDAVAITFEELYKKWGNEADNTYGDNPTFIGVSNDGGLSFTEYEIHQDFILKEETDNPGYMMVNISNIGGNQANVQIYLRMRGYWDYWWQIDDFKVIEGAYNNLEVNDLEVEGVVDGYSWGYFSQIPYSQNMDMVFFTTLSNNGVDPQTNVTITCEVSDGSSIVYSQAVDTSSLASDSTITMYPDLFTPTTSGEYVVSATATQTEIEDVPEDNVSGSVDWRVTDNNIIARDYEYTRGLGPQSYPDGGEGDFMGCDFIFANATNVNSISVFIDFRTTPGTTIIGQVYRQESGGPIKQIESEDYIISANDLGQWIDLGLITVDADDDTIIENGLYTAGVEFYWSGIDSANCWIGADNNDRHIFDQNSAYREGATWFWIYYIPMVRMNLDGAILPPVFATNPMSEVCAHPTDNVSYTKTITVTDPQALPCTITAVDLPDFITDFVDNGNNTATVTFEMEPGDIGEDPYQFNILADNGSAINEQFYWMYVDNYDGCTFSIEDEVVNNLNIYPNPTTGILNIENVAGANIEVYNIVGELVTSVVNASYFTSIDISNLSDGTYIVKVILESNVISQQINLIR